METTQTFYNFVQAYFDLDNNNNNNNTSNTNNNNSHPPTSSKQMETSNNNNNHNNNQHEQYKEDSLMEEALQMPFFKKALQIMENVPHYHAHTLELIASSRSSTLTCKFFSFLRVLTVTAEFSTLELVRLVYRSTTSVRKFIIP